MNLRILYQWKNEVSSRLSSLTVWQRSRLASFSLGVLLVEHCHQSKIAKVLADGIQADSVVRQLRRCISDEKWSAAQFSKDWTRWIVSCLPTKQFVLLVDETTISNRFSVMMVGVAYEGRCIPLIWRCYKAMSREDYPAEGQVKMIANMLSAIKPSIPAGKSVIVMADRGIGTSPTLCKAVEALGWHYLFRVQKTVKIETDNSVLQPYKQASRGGGWSASGLVFIKRGRIPAHVRLIWDEDCAEPWNLVTNDPELTGREYAMRNWQEQSFRDLKSGGWQLEMCRLRCADRLGRFLAILAMAQGLALSLGSLAVRKNKARRLIKTKSGKLRRPLSLFKEGIVYLNRYILGQENLPPIYFFRDRRLC